MEAKKEKRKRGYICHIYIGGDEIHIMHTVTSFTIAKHDPCEPPQLIENHA